MLDQNKYSWKHSKTWTLNFPNGITKQLTKYIRNAPGDLDGHIFQYNSVQWRFVSGETTTKIYPKTTLFLLSIVYMVVKINKISNQIQENRNHYDRGYLHGCKYITQGQMTKQEARSYIEEIIKLNNNHKKKNIVDLFG